MYIYICPWIIIQGVISIEDERKGSLVLISLFMSTLRCNSFRYSAFCIYIYFVCLSVCLYPINVKTAEPIGPNFGVGPHVTPKEGLRMIKISKLGVKKFFNFCKILKMREKII